MSCGVDLCVKVVGSSGLLYIYNGAKAFFRKTHKKATHQVIDAIRTTTEGDNRHFCLLHGSQPLSQQAWGCGRKVPSVMLAPLSEEFFIPIPHW